jgi:hypothetical protein
MEDAVCFRISLAEAVFEEVWPTDGAREGTGDGVLAVKQPDPHGEVETGVESGEIEDACGTC